MKSQYREFTGLNLPSIEKEVLERWTNQKTFEQSVSLRQGAPAFVFYEGPPSANGMPGIHHVISRTLKDLVCRYKTMQGFQVKRKGGWDCLRHYEIMGNSCIPLFEDIQNAPRFTMMKLPKALLTKVMFFEKNDKQRPRIVIYEWNQERTFKRKVCYLQMIMMAGK